MASTIPDLLLPAGPLANRPAAGVAGRLYPTSDQTPNVIYRDTGSAWVAWATIPAATADTDERAKVSANDTTAGYLLSKLVAGSNVTITETNDGGAETIVIAAAGGSLDTDEKTKVSGNDTTAGYLLSKLVAGTGVTITENNDGSNETITIAASGGGGGTVDGSVGFPRDVAPSSPNALSDEFDDSTNTADWSTFGTLATFDIDTTAGEAAYLRNTTADSSSHGIYKLGLVAGNVVEIKLRTMRFNANYQRVGVFVGENASPASGKTVCALALYQDGTFRIGREMWNSRTRDNGFNLEHFANNHISLPIYFRLTVTSTTSVKVEWSRTGDEWITIDSALNPGFASIGSFGIVLAGFNANPVTATVEYIRVS